MIVKNCKVTKTDSRVMGNSAQFIELSGKYVYSVCDSVVVEVSKTSATLYRVVIQYDMITSFLYGNLTNAKVVSGQTLKTGDLIGECFNSIAHFEYLTQSPFDSKTTVYIGKVLYYKQNPLQVVDGTFKFNSAITAYDCATSNTQAIENAQSTVTPYIVTVGENELNLNISKLKEARVSAVLLYGGSYYDEIHIKNDTYKSKNLKSQYNFFIKYLYVAEYYYVRARSIAESNAEIDAMKAVLRTYRPDLGIWLRLQLVKDKSTNDSILENYIKKLNDYGFTGKIGLYVTRTELSKISWEDKWKDILYLWLIDFVKDVNNISLTPNSDFFNL